MPRNRFSQSKSRREAIPGGKFGLDLFSVAGEHRRGRGGDEVIVQADTDHVDGVMLIANEGLAVIGDVGVVVIVAIAEATKLRSR